MPYRLILLFIQSLEALCGPLFWVVRELTAATNAFIYVAVHYHVPINAYISVHVHGIHSADSLKFHYY